MDQVKKYFNLYLKLFLKLKKISGRESRFNTIVFSLIHYGVCFLFGRLILRPMVQKSLASHMSGMGKFITANSMTQKHNTMINIHNNFSDTWNILFYFQIFTILPIFLIFVRRAHDSNWRGWWIFFSMIGYWLFADSSFHINGISFSYIGYLSLIFLLYLVLKNGTENSNRFGPVPAGYNEEERIISSKRKLPRKNSKNRKKLKTSKKTTLTSKEKEICTIIKIIIKNESKNISQERMTGLLIKKGYSASSIREAYEEYNENNRNN